MHFADMVLICSDGMETRLILRPNHSAPTEVESLLLSNHHGCSTLLSKHTEYLVEHGIPCTLLVYDNEYNQTEALPYI